MRTRIASNKSPWLARTEVGEVYTVPISHGEGRFLAAEELLRTPGGQRPDRHPVCGSGGHAPPWIWTCNPNGSVCAMEGITSPDGRVLGKMGHSERIGDRPLQKCAAAMYDMELFASRREVF